MDFSTDIKYIKGVGDVVAGLFNKLGIFKVGDLLFNFPRDYEDWSKIFREFPTQGSNSHLLHLAGTFFTTEPPGKSYNKRYY